MEFEDWTGRMHTRPPPSPPSSGPWMPPRRTSAPASASSTAPTTSTSRWCCCGRSGGDGGGPYPLLKVASTAAATICSILGALSYLTGMRPGVYDLAARPRNVILHSKRDNQNDAGTVYPCIASGCRDALGELDLTETILQDPLHYGFAHWADCTGNDPANMPGLVMWGKATRRLREGLTVRGWTVDNHQNCPLTIHPKGKLAIMVVAGDNATGDPAREPASRYPRGPVTRTLVFRNQLFFAFYAAMVQDQPPPPRQTWMLLHYLAGDQLSDLRAELSLPAALTEEGDVVRWRERIILDLGEMDSVVQALPPTKPLSPVDVPVRMKT